MKRSARFFAIAFFSFSIVIALLVGGCTRYANEEQMTTLEESQSNVTGLEKQIAEKEKEKAELQAKLAEKQEELKMVKSEKEKVLQKLGM